MENLPFRVVTYIEKVKDQNNAVEQWKITKNTETNPRRYRYIYKSMYKYKLKKYIYINLMYVKGIKTSRQRESC